MALQKKNKLLSSFRINFLSVMTGNIIYGIGQWIILIILAKNVDLAGVGRFSFGIALTAPIFMFFSFRLREVQATDANNKYSFSDYLALRLVSIAAGIFVTIIIISIINIDFEKAIIVFLFALVKAVEAVSDIYYGYMQKTERMSYWAYSLSIKSVTSVTLVFIGVILFKNSIAAVTGMLISNTLLLFFYDKRKISKLMHEHEDKVSRGLFSCVDRKTLITLFIFVIPLGLVQLLANLRVNIPKFIIDDLLGENSLGLFSALAYFQILGARVVNAFAQAGIPRLAKRLVENDTQGYVRLFTKLITIAFGIGIIGILVSFFFGEFITSTIYTSDYSTEPRLFVWIMVASTFEFIDILIIASLMALKRYKLLIPMYMTSIITITIFGFILIPKFELMGAVYSLNLASALTCIVGFAINTYLIVKLKNNSVSGGTQKPDKI